MIGAAASLGLAALAFAAAAHAGTAPAAARHPACHASRPSGDTYHVIPRGDTFDGWSDRHAGGPANVLSATIQCGPGIQSLAFFDYVNRGSLHARLDQATGVWVPPGSYEK